MNANNSVLCVNAGNSFLVAEMRASGMALLVQGRNRSYFAGAIALLLGGALAVLAACILAAAVNAHPGMGTAQTPTMITATDGKHDDPAAADPLTIFWDRRSISGPMSSKQRRKIRRTRAEIQEERRKLLEKTNQEIDAIVREFHEKLPRDQAKGLGSLYARFSTRFQDSWPIKSEPFLRRPTNWGSSSRGSMCISTWLSRAIKTDGLAWPRCDKRSRRNGSTPSSCSPPTACSGAHTRPCSSSRSKSSRRASGQSS